MNCPNIYPESYSELNLVLTLLLLLSDLNKGMSESITSIFFLKFLFPRVASDQYKSNHVNFSFLPNLQSFLMGLYIKFGFHVSLSMAIQSSNDCMSQTGTCTN